MMFVLVVAILLVMGVLAVAGPLLEDVLEWGRRVSHRRGQPVRPRPGHRVAAYAKTARQILK